MDKELNVIIRAKDNASHAIKNVQDAAQRASDSVKGGWDKSVAASQKFAAGVAVAGAAAVGFGVASVGAFMESQNALTQLDSVLKSTGGSAGITKESAVALASSLQSVTTFSDEAVLGVENMMLTFTNVGKEVFPQATEAALDMAQALGEDPVASSMRLGKALNDPIQGVTALRRVGVQLSDAQEKQVEGFMAVGDVASAQKVILAELAKEFGGSARAAAGTFGGQLKQLWNIINDGMEVIGGVIAGAIRPFIQAILDFISRSGGMEGVIKKMGDVLQQVAPYFPIIAGAIIGGLVPAMVALAVSTWSAMAPLLPFIAAGAAIAAVVLFVVNALGGWGKVMQTIGPILQGLWTAVKAVFGFLGSIIGGVLKALQPVFNFFGVMIRLIADIVVNHLWPALQQLWQALQPLIPILKIIGIIFLIALVAPIVIFIAVLLIVIAVVAAVVTFVVQIITFLANVWSAIWGVIGGVVTAVWNVIKAVVSAVISGVVNVIQTYLAIAQAIFNAVWSAIVAIVTGAINAVKNIINGIAAIVGFIGNIMNGVRNVISNVWNGIIGFVGGLVGKFISLGSDIIGGVVNGLRNAAGDVINFIKNLFGDVIGIAKKILKIGSPSKVFMDQGAAMMQGMAIGIQRNAALVRGALSGALDTPEVIAPVTGSNTSSGRSRGTTGAAGGPVEYHFHIGTLVATEQGTRDFSRKVYEQLNNIARANRKQDALPDIGLGTQ